MEVEDDLGSSAVLSREASQTNTKEHIKAPFVFVLDEAAPGSSASRIKHVFPLGEYVVLLRLAN